MNAVLTAIGDELLSGVRLEKNANFMAWHLHNKGIEVKAIEVISDYEDEIINLLSRWIGKTDLLILSGGLGPTHDDKTRYAIAKYLGCELYSDSMYDKILSRVKDNPDRLARLEKSRSTQAMIPVKAQPVYNPTGSALGIKFTKDNTQVIALPGVPMEYEAMTRQELPEIFAQDNKHVWASIIILGLPEMTIAERIPEVINNHALHVSILPAFPQVELIIRGKPDDVDEAEKLTRSRFDDVLPKGCKSLAEAVLYEAKINHAKISCSESCTGGLVGAALTEIAGSSEVFNGSAVTYSNNAKHKILGVDGNIIANFGAVSKECAVSMAEGALRIYDSDYAVSITGIAGPDGGTESKPVGTVYFGLASREKACAFMKVLPGNRSEIRTRAVRFALAELWRTLHNKNLEPKL
ncbi:MAG: nicotinamide-nucleotide amidohydrolase family protein [Synergistaceae bacterium]|nr:nicotinamide-nucleotide amidohydrolase family protein [Synergistaceae bacterium]